MNISQSDDMVILSNFILIVKVTLNKIPEFVLV